MTAAMLHSNADYSVYEGRQVTGWPVLTLRRGEIVFSDGQILGQPGSGHVLSPDRNTIPVNLEEPPIHLGLKG